jgi:hypothetical protein
MSVTLSIFQLDISGIDIIEEQPLNILLISVTLEQNLKK